MLYLNNLRSPKGAHKKKRHVGRGPGSGSGKTSARGQKGQMSRSGKTIRPGFEGGQMPLIRRIPKRGFTNKFRQEYQIINLQTLERCENKAAVGPDEFRKLGFIASARVPVKILGKGALTKVLTVRAHKFSQSAAAAIAAQGGKVEVLNA